MVEIAVEVDRLLGPEPRQGHHLLRHPSAAGCEGPQGVRLDRSPPIFDAEAEPTACWAVTPAACFATSAVWRRREHEYGSGQIEAPRCEVAEDDDWLAKDLTTE